MGFWMAPEPGALTNPAPIERFTAGDPIGEVTAAVDRDGVVIVEQMIDDAILARLNEQLDPYVEAEDAGRKGFLSPEQEFFAGANTRSVGALGQKWNATC